MATQPVRLQSFKPLPLNLTDSLPLCDPWSKLLVNGLCIHKYSILLLLLVLLLLLLRLFTFIGIITATTTTRVGVLFGYLLGFFLYFLGF